MTLPDQIAARTRYHSLIAQAIELRDPSRRAGPSVHEAEEAARSMEIEAEQIARVLYWVGADEARRACGMEGLDVEALIRVATSAERESLCACAGVEME